MKKDSLTFKITFFYPLGYEKSILLFNLRLSKGSKMRCLVVYSVSSILVDVSERDALNEKLQILMRKNI